MLHDDVFVKVAVLREVLATDGAFEGLFSGVLPEVYLHVQLARKHLFAQITLKAFANAVAWLLHGNDLKKIAMTGH